MLQHCADHMDLISEHFYVGERPRLLSHVRQPRRVAQIARAHRRYRKRFASLQGEGYSDCPGRVELLVLAHVYGELGTQYFLKDALGAAAAE